MKRIFALLMIVVCLLGLAANVYAADETATILFTHDLHSHFEPALDGSGNSYGGFARLKTVIDRQKQLHPDAVLLDGGDFSMGTLFQTIYSTQASELRLMGRLGYDVTTLGNHEFDYRPDGFARMLCAAVDSGDALPQIVEANYIPAAGNDQRVLQEAIDRYGIKDYTVIKRGDINFAVFGIMGKDSHECAPLSGMELQDPIAEAKRVVKEIEENVPQPRLVICLSHSGTNESRKKSEDEQLAAKVDGIDVIISGHTHTTLEEPIVVNDTYIVSCGEYGKYLGVLTLDGKSKARCELISIDDTVTEDPGVLQQVTHYKEMVENDYLTQFGDLTFDQELAYNPYTFEDISIHQEAELGNLIADSYRWAVEQAEGEGGTPVDFALTANGVIRESLPKGSISVQQVFNMLSLGIGADGVPGYPLVSVWVTGKDLKNAFEVDASITSIMPAAQLYFTGMTYTFNPNRMIFNKVTQCAQVLDDGSTVPIEDDKLYRVVTGLYCGQMLGSVNAKSFGILNITPRDAQGNEIRDLEKFIVCDQNGREIKEWYAVAGYLQMLGEIPDTYAAPQGRKVIYDTLNLFDLIKSPNWVTLTVMALGIILIAGVVFFFCLIVRKIRRKRKA